MGGRGQERQVLSSLLSLMSRPSLPNKGRCVVVSITGSYWPYPYSVQMCSCVECVDEQTKHDQRKQRLARRR